MKPSKKTLCVLTSLLFCVSSTAFSAEEIALEHAGAKRSYLVHVPKSYIGTTPVPVLIALHGTNMRGADMLTYTDLPRKAESIGFVLIAPNSRGLAFNDGSPSGGPETAGTDDVAYIEAVAEDAKRRYRVLPQSIFVAGFSSSGSMAQRIQIESRYPFAGFASVANTFRVQAGGASNLAPLLLVFGTADPFNPVAGGEVTMPYASVKPSHEDTARNWSIWLKCSDDGITNSPAQGVKAKTWTHCADRARLAWYEIEGLGHHWAGADPMPFPAFIVGEQVSSPNLTDLIWDFFMGARR